MESKKSWPDLTKALNWWNRGSITWLRTMITELHRKRINAVRFCELMSTRLHKQYKYNQCVEECELNLLTLHSSMCSGV
jgi:hypothetical protein